MNKNKHQQQNTNNTHNANNNKFLTKKTHAKCNKQTKKNKCNNRTNNPPLDQTTKRTQQTKATYI